MNEMTRTALEELSSSYRISNGYHDIEGSYHPTSDDTRRALLAAMGIAASNETEVLESLEHHRRVQWQRVLPAVKVFNEQQPVQVCVTIPRDEQGKIFRWVIETEDGSCYEKEFSPKDLTVLDENVLDNTHLTRFNLTIDMNIDTGYHWLRLAHPPEWGTGTQMRLIIVPERCYLPREILSGKRLWGMSVQLYAIRSERNWGIGDFGDLVNVIQEMSKLGCGCIGLNPLHSLYPHRPGDASPYSPSSRLFLNPLYIEIDGMEDFRESRVVRERVMAEAFQQRLAELRSCPLVDYESVAELKNSILRLLYVHFCHNHLQEITNRGRQFRWYQKTQGENLRRHALFEALCARLNDPSDAAGDGDGWRDWPTQFHAIETETIKRLADLDDATVEFYEYLQWQTETQLERAYTAAIEHGLTLSLYQDLAVGCDLNGSDTWANPTLYAHSAHIGSPPDAFSAAGQDWRLAPYIPHQLEDFAYKPFIDLLRRNMRHAGVLRIDHVMSMQRLFWIPEQKGVPGTYVDYSMHELQGILALESQRNRCLVIGEDLGTVSNELRSSMSKRDIFSYKVFYFEKYWHCDHSYKRADAYPAHALVTATTHDLPTVKGFWCEVDLKLRDDLGLFPNTKYRNKQYSDRDQDRTHLIDVLQQEGLWEQAGIVDGDMPPDLNEALHVFLARSAAALMMIQIEDMLQVGEQTNLPGTTLEYPNWRRKLPLSLQLWVTDARITNLIDRVQVERSRDV